MSGFHSIPVLFESGSDFSPHYLFYKRHNRKSERNSQTLFVVNVPPYCNEDGLRNVFSDCGTIKEVHLLDQPGSYDDNEKMTTVLQDEKSQKFKVAYVVFANDGCVDTALELSSSVTRYITTKEKPVYTGVEKWIYEYKEKYPDCNIIQNKVDEYMKQFDVQEEEKKKALRMTSEPDEEGWVTIPVTKRSSGTNENTKTKRINKKLDKKKRSEKELANFYLFQQREAKRDKIAYLRKKFEDDKKKIGQMRQQRKFKPF